MITALPTFQEYPAFTFLGTYGDAQRRFRFYYRPRLGSWYFDVLDEDGEKIAMGRRVTEQWLPLVGYALEGLDGDVTLYIQGPSPYKREDLGDQLALFLIPQDDLPETTETTYAVSFRLIFNQSFSAELAGAVWAAFDAATAIV